MEGMWLKKENKRERKNGMCVYAFFNIVEHSTCCTIPAYSSAYLNDSTLTHRHTHVHTEAHKYR